MAKIEFKTFLDASKYSKNLALALNSTTSIKREGHVWWLDDPRLDQVEYDYVTSGSLPVAQLVYAEAPCTVCNNPVDTSLLRGVRAKSKFKTAGTCQGCQDEISRQALEPLTTKFINCYVCKRKLYPELEVSCEMCGAFVCSECGACKCNFKGLTKDKKQKPDPIEYFKETVNNSTMVLIDMAFLSSEFKSYREFYAELYSGNDPEYPAKAMPLIIQESALIEALCKYVRVKKDKATFCVFQQSFGKDVLEEKKIRSIKRITCKEPIFFEMSNIIQASPTIKRVVFMADDIGYVSLIKMLQKKSYAIGLIKHKQEKDSDYSSMPPELPYQYSYYVIGECLGLRQDEL